MAAASRSTSVETSLERWNEVGVIWGVWTLSLVVLELIVTWTAMDPLYPRCLSTLLQQASTIKN